MTETERRNKQPAKQSYLKQLLRAQRLSSGLNTAIMKGEKETIEKWQILDCLNYGVPFFNWMASQDKADYSRLKKKWEQLNI